MSFVAPKPTRRSRRRCTTVQYQCLSAFIDEVATVGERCRPKVGNDSDLKRGLSSHIRRRIALETMLLNCERTTGLHQCCRQLLEFGMEDDTVLGLFETPTHDLLGPLHLKQNRKEVNRRLNDFI